MFEQLRGASKMTRGIVMASLVMREIEAGSPRWQNRGGQDRGWRVLNYVTNRWWLPIDVYADIVNGLLRAGV